MDLNLVKKPRKSDADVFESDNVHVFLRIKDRVNGAGLARLGEVAKLLWSGHADRNSLLKKRLTDKISRFIGS